MLTASHNRVSEHTCESVNEEIRDAMERRLMHYRHASKDQITDRLGELEEEWDIERVLETNAATLACSGCLLTALVDRKWVLLPLAVTGFLLQHALQGWCPPLPILRRMGFRTQQEIDEERHALKWMRGDFSELTQSDTQPAISTMMHAIRR